jgi:capsular exopolysaccharide synthesis family protein
MSQVSIGLAGANELTISGLLALLRRRRKIIALTSATCLLLGILVCLFTTRRYEATGILEVQRSSADMLGLASMMANPSDGAGDALNANLDLQTEGEILKSDTLALKVIRDLKLDKTWDFQSHWSPIGWALGLITPSGPKDQATTNPEDAPGRRSHLLRVFRQHLTIKMKPGTRLIEIRYLDSDPKLASAVVNDLAHALMDYGFQTRYSATNQSSEWLTGQLADLKKQAQDLQEKVVNLQKYSGVYTVGMDSQGHDQVYSGTLDRLQQATTALSSATSNRIMKEALYQTVKNGDPELISGLAGANLAGASSGVQNSFSLLETLRSQQATLQSQLATDSSKFGAEYPKLADERSSLKSVNKAISEEVARIGKRAANDFKAAQTAENNLRSQYAQRKADAERLNDKAIEYGIAKQEADDSRGLYEDLFKRLKEAGVMEGLRSSNITVVEPGRTPARPAKPNVPVYLGISLVAGLFLGGCGALLADALDNRIQSFEAVEAFLGSPLLGVLPVLRRAPRFSLHIATRKWLTQGTAAVADQPLTSVGGPATAFGEALRALRTKLLLSRSAAPPKVILVTSSVPGEGKSTVSANLSALLAQSNKRVLLVEADMRNPSFGRRLGSADAPAISLSELLADAEIAWKAEKTQSVSGVNVLQAGPLPPYPAELLGSEHMRDLLEKWKLHFDYIVLDSPPLLAVTDAEILSDMADMTLLIARPGLTSWKALRRAYETVVPQGRSRVGVVLNAVDRDSAGYGDYYGYSGSTYYAKSEERLHA